MRQNANLSEWIRRLYREDILKLIEVFRPKINPLEDYYTWESLFKENFSFDCKVDTRTIQEIIKELENKNYPPFFGIPISALINHSSERDVEIEVKKPLDYLGINKEGGRLVIKGNAGDYPGCYMKSGEIIVEGNAGEGVGAYMNGGRIVIKGKAEGEIGYMMRGGEIYVNNLEFENLSNYIYSGEIYKGLPENNPELILKSEILKKSENEIVLLFWKKKRNLKKLI